MKLWAAIKKDMRILLRDKVGLLLMFAMPVLLVIVVTSIQQNTFDAAGKKNIEILVSNKDTDVLSRDFLHVLDTMGLFKLIVSGPSFTDRQLADEMRSKNIVAGIAIHPFFSTQIKTIAKNTSGKALKAFGLEGDTVAAQVSNNNYLTLYYNPVIQQSLRLSIQGAVNSTLQIIQSRETLKQLYFSINEAPMPDSLQHELLAGSSDIKEVVLTANNAGPVEMNVTQHNVPAWTVFAMFFVVMSLGSGIVREKRSGSFIRLKTLPTNYYLALVSKQIVYLLVTFLQAAVIFALGMYFFPLIGLPALHLPQDIFGLIIVTLVCGWCAVSYAICIGTFAQTEEQANAFGSVSIIILSMIGGLMIPDFIMPQSFKSIMSISPLHWCLQAYYGLFLQGGRLKDVGINILSLLMITFALQAIALFELKRKKLI